jgi:hypothetical protein
LNLLNTDILNLAPGGFLKIFYEFLAFFYEDYVEDEVLKRVCSDTPEDREQLERARDLLAGSISHLLWKLYWRQQFQTYPELKNDPHYSSWLDEIKTTKVWDSDEVQISFAYHLQGERIALIPEIKIYEYDNLQTEDEIEVVREFRRFEDIGKDALAVRESIAQKWKEQGVDKEVVDFIEKAPDHVPFGKFSKFCDPTMFATLKFQIYALLEKFPLSSIYKCPQCSSYFVATRKKQSEYCTRCIKKKHVYKWREKNRPVYNAYQRNLQKGVKTSVKEIRDDLAQEEKKGGKK